MKKTLLTLSFCTAAAFLFAQLAHHLVDEPLDHAGIEHVEHNGGNHNNKGHNIVARRFFHQGQKGFHWETSKMGQAETTA